MTSQNMTAAEKMKKARTRLILDDPFYGALSMRMHMRPINPKDRLEYLVVKNSCAVDGIRIVYDPAWVDTLTVLECKGLLAHEISHVALKHNLRRGDRDWKLWNLAGDHIIDPILRDAGFELPDIGNGQRGHFDNELSGKTTEQAYEILKQRKIKKEQDDAEKLKNMLKLKPDSGDCEPAGGDQPDDQPAPSDENSNDQDDSGPQEPDDGFDGDLPREGHPTFDDDEQINPRLSDEEDLQGGKDGQDDEEKNLDFNKLDIPNMPGMGVVLDMPIDMDDNKAVDEADEDLTIAIEDAYKAAKMHGNMPAGLERLIEKQQEHKIDWKEELHDFMEKTLDRCDYSWLSPSRRYLGHGLVLPGLSEEETLPQIVVVCDTSGSVSQNELKQYAAEISEVLERFECRFKVIYCDTRVNNEEDFSYEDLPIKLNAVGGGGTCFKPAFEYIEKEQIETEAIVFFTDMDAWDWPKLKNYRPNLPVLWLDSDNGRIVNRLGFELPFGKHIILEIDKT